MLPRDYKRENPSTKFHENRPCSFSVNLLTNRQTAPKTILYPSSRIHSVPISPASHCPHQNKQDHHGSQQLENSISLAVPQKPEDCPICALSLKEGTRAVGDSNANGEEDEEDAVKETGKEENHLEERGDGEKKRKRTCFGHCRDIWNDMRRKLWGIVESKYFSRGIMIAILINTISMGIEHHNQVR